MATTITLEELYRPVRDELALVRTQMEALWREMMSLVNGNSRANLEMVSGGKLMRPALCLLSAGAAGSRDLGPFVPAAVAVELFHLAALAHDDVIDRAATRRGNQSLNALWTNHTAVLGGDYLVARGMSLLAGTGVCAVLDESAQCMTRMARGELVDYGRSKAPATRRACMDVVQAKTASLFALACVLPCRMARFDCGNELHGFGHALGTAFQLVDDLLDLSGDTAALGKPVFGDVTGGKRTLPLLCLRERLEPAERERLDGMAGAPLTDSGRQWLTDVLERTNALDEPRQTARDYIAKAQRHLENLPEGECREAMFGVSEFVLARSS